MAAPLRRVLMRRPGAVADADPAVWHYAGPIDAERLVDQYDNFVEAVTASGAVIEWIDPADDGLHDSIFTYDPSFMTPAGAVICSPGKALRQPEAELHRRFYETAGVPILGQIDPPGLIEGGDCFYIDASTIAIGRGFRTNAAGIDAFAALVTPHGIDVEVYDLPYGGGPDACLHLMSLISPLADDLALVYEPALPVALHQRLVASGYTLLAAPEDEFAASKGLTLNVLATAPRQVIAIDGFPHTVALLRDAGCTVATFAADALCIPCEGGPTCMTRPLWRGDSPA